jgi:hypothetical protein
MKELKAAEKRWQVERAELKAQIERLREAARLTTRKPSLTMTVGQFRDAIQFAGPGVDEDLEIEITFAHRDAGVDENGDAYEAGLVMYYTDYPEEGCIPLPALEEPK